MRIICFHCTPLANLWEELQMFAELQMLTPMVPTREVYFIRHCKQLSADSWAIVDVSIDRVEDNIDASIGKCRKRPSGCIIQDKCNGHCKVCFCYLMLSTLCRWQLLTQPRHPNWDPGNSSLRLTLSTFGLRTSNPIKKMDFIRIGFQYRSLTIGLLDDMLKSFGALN